jgi:hypothetical protein
MNLLRNLLLALFWSAAPLAVVGYAVFISNHDNAMARAYAGK